MRAIRRAHAQLPPSGSYLIDSREVLFPHDPRAERLQAVKNVLIQASLSELKAHGHYDRYATLIDAEVLQQLLVASLSPGWVPVELAHAHYDACDRLDLNDEEYAAIGRGVGDRVQSTVLISQAKKAPEVNHDLWLSVDALHRMWPRVFLGGSVQTSRLGPREMLIEERGYSLNRYEYYRYGHIAALTATYAALGTNATVQIVDYSRTRDEMSVMVSWL